MSDQKTIIIKRREGNELFHQYKPLNEIGPKSFESFKKFFSDKKGFPISEKDKRYGTLSNVMALSTLLELEDMGVDISEFQEQFHAVLQAVFGAAYKNGYTASPVFDATPYLDEKNEKFDCYVETASKILIVMIDLERYANKNDINKTPFGEPIILAGQTVRSFLELAAISERLLIDAVKFLNASALRVKESEIQTRQIEKKTVVRDNLPSKIEYRGWTFCKPEEGENDLYSTSIYYTYHATNAYVSFYNSYPDVFERIFGESDSNSQSVGKEEKNEEKKELEKRVEKFIQDNKDRIDDFRKKTASAGRYIENLLSDRGIDIAIDFVKNDFSKISFSDIVNTQGENAVINTLFILAIYLNSGIDEDYESMSSGHGYKLKKDKNWLYNQLQFSISNIKKIYNLLKVERKQELIDSFNLQAALMSEEYPSKQDDLVEQLRRGCKNVSVYNLIPLLCNTYKIVFDYIIKYPQLDMVDNLELIQENLSNKEGEWLWGDADGFNINNNLYYIVALENFYEYYEEYEERLTGNEEIYEERAKKERKAIEKKLVEERERNKNLEEQNRQLEQAYNEKGSELDSAVKKLVKEMFGDLMIDELEKMLLQSTDLYIKAISSNERPEKFIEEFENDKRLRIALALYSSIDFKKVVLGGGRDFALLGKDGEEYNTKRNDGINESIATNVSK